MKNKGMPILHIAILFILIGNLSCTTMQYIQDQDSFQRQKEIRRKRTGNMVGSAFLTIGSVVVAAFTGVYVSYLPEGSNMKIVTLENKGQDTLQVNMLTDLVWKDSTYADIMNIRIPPEKKCRLLVPVGSVYNLYFSNTFDTTGDDEYISLDTSGKRKVTLYPGLTFVNDTLSNDSIIAP